MDWYYATNGQQNGPVSKEQLIQLFQGGEVSGSDLVWNDTMTDWVPFQSVGELNPAGDAPAAEAAVEESAPSAAEPVASTPSSTGSTLTPAASATAASASIPPGEKIPTYLWQSIVCLVLCCLPAAIPALIFATKVEPAQKAGDIAAAQEASAKAKMWCWIAFGVGLLANLFFFAMGIIGAIAEEM